MIDILSPEDCQPDEYACRLISMHMNALDSMHASAHGYTQFDACPSIPIDAGLDHTCFEVASSICEAPMTIRLTRARVD